MNQIYRRNIAAQLEQIKTNPSLVIVFANDCYEQFEENKIFIDDIYKLLQNNPWLAKLCESPDNCQVNDKRAWETLQFGLL